MHVPRLEQVIRVTAATLLVLLTPVIVAAQQVTFSGRVTADNGQPLPGAGVSITELGAGAITNAEGHYTFTVDQRRLPRTVTLTARFIGYKPQRVTLAAPTGN